MFGTVYAIARSPFAFRVPDPRRPARALRSAGLVGAQVGQIERDARRVGGGLQLLQRSSDVGGRVAALRKVGLKKGSLDGSVVLSLVPITEVVITEVVRMRRLGEESDDAVLRLALGAGLFCHAHFNAPP